MVHAAKDKAESEEIPEVLPEIASYFVALAKLANENQARLGTVGGNLCLHVIDGPTLTIVTSGPRAGVYLEATELDTIDFLIAAEEWFWLELIDPAIEVDLEAASEGEFLFTEGNNEIYDRFLKLGDKQNLLSLRCAKAA